ncbi:MAG: ACT domain-containing protein [Candidatus Micrarchaeia archaeon]
MREFVVIAKDRVGLLHDITKALADENINIDSIAADTVGGKAFIRIVCSNERKAEEVLRKKKYKVVTSEVIVVKLKNRPGELSEMTKKLAKARINIENVHLLHKGAEEGIFALKVDKHDKALKVLKDYF